LGLILDLDKENGLRSFWRIDGWVKSSDRKMLSKLYGASSSNSKNIGEIMEKGCGVDVHRDLLVATIQAAKRKPNKPDTS
jgi:hypothetical protein